MQKFVEITKNIYDKYFDNYVKSIDHNENYLKFIWLTFAYLKKKILKRKNDFELSSYLLCYILEIFGKELKSHKTKIETHIETNLGLGNHEMYLKEISSISNKNMDTKLYDHILKVLNEDFPNSLNIKKDGNYFFIETDFNSNSNINSLKRNNDNYILLESAYIEILISDEIDDLKILENYLTEKKLNSKFINNIHHNSFSVSKPTLSSNQNGKIFHKNSFDMYDMQSPKQTKIGSNYKLDIDMFFKDVSEYTFLDISYLFKKYGLFNTDNKTFRYEILFFKFNKFFFNFVLNRLKDKIELNYESHKNIYLKLSDELLQQEKTKFNIKDFNFILNDVSFHFNFLTLTFFIYLNFLLIERNDTLDELCMNYIQSLNKFEYFELRNIFKIITNLAKIEIPYNIKNIIKKLQKGLISYVIWKNDSFIFCDETESSHEGNMEKKKIFDKVLLYIVSFIFKLSNCFNIEPKLREKIWKIIKFIFSYDISLLRENYLDCVIVHVMYYVISNHYQNIQVNKNILNDLCDKYFQIKINSMFKNLFYENSKKFESNGFIKIINRICMTIDNDGGSRVNNLGNELKFQSKYMDYDISSIIPCLQDDFNVIYSISPISCKIIQDYMVGNTRSNENSVDYLGNKRIRQLNSPASSKILTFSPYGRKSSLTLKSNSAFKNLNVALLNAQKEKQP